MTLLLLFLVCSLIQTQNSWAQETVELPAIVIEGSSSDALLYDPILPTRERKVEEPNATGSIVQEISEELPVPINQFSVPGSTTQVRGLGRTVEDTNVQTLGIPLNPVQGGGFDFSTFPQFFWSEYRYHLGPSSGAFDPRASSGTLSLIPWTADALASKKQRRFRLTQTITRGLSQTSVAGKYDHAAALVGYSAVNAQGPTGSVSAELLNSKLAEIKAHVLGTSVDLASPGSVSFPTPQARLQVNRWMPVVEANLKPSSELLIKETLFYDNGSVRNVNPQSSANDSYDRFTQLGSESVVFWNDWSAGLSVRRTSFRQIGFEVPTEWVGHVQLGRLFRYGESANATSEISVQADGVSRTGWKPGATLGQRYDFSSELGVFAKANYTNRFPTIQDRYYQIPFFTPNPGLKPEQALSFNLGGEYRRSAIQTSLQTYFQFRQDAQLLQTDPTTFATTVINGGNVRMLSLLHDLTWQPVSWFEVSNGLRLSNSRIQDTGLRVPYDPVVTETFRARAHDLSSRWGGGASLRAVGPSEISSTSRNTGYALINIDADYRLTEIAGGDLFLQGRIDNLTDRHVQVTQGYPLIGRLYSLSIVGSL